MECRNLKSPSTQQAHLMFIFLLIIRNADDEDGKRKRQNENRKRSATYKLNRYYPIQI